MLLLPGGSCGHAPVFGNGGEVRQVIVELTNGILITTTHTRTFGYQMTMLIRQVQACHTQPPQPSKPGV